VGGNTMNATIQNSVFAEPSTFVKNGTYPSSQIMQSSSFDGFVMKNNEFYQLTANPFDVNNATFTGNYTFLGCDSFGCGAPFNQSFGYSGATKYGDFNGSTTGSIHNYAFNNYFNATNNPIGTGSSVNDPSTSGIENDLQWIGNWIVATTGTIDSCTWRIFGGTDPSCQLGGFMTVEGNEVNGFIVTNNSIIASASAQLNANSPGCNESGGGSACGLDSNNNQTFQARTINYNATQNYLSSPSNQYNHDSSTISPTVSGNFCSGSSGGAWCTTSGFTNAPTASFTLGARSGGVVPFATTAFTAQYGAVKWLTSTSPTTPASNDARWQYLPPASLAAASGSTIYLWTMDCAGGGSACNSSGNHISSPASAVAP
jgi:hypothetical protein